MLPAHLCPLQKREPENTGTHNISCDLLVPRDRESAALLWPDRHTETAELLCLILASGRQGPALPQKARL